ncbi:MAG: DinB family protein [Myxococcota bacterium]
MGVTRSESVARRDALIAQYQQVRGWTERLAEPLAPEDQVIQTAPFASPTKWHRAHTTWFFETFVLKTLDPNYVPLSDDYAFLFNSYYNAVGPQFTRGQRGLLSRPTVAEVGAFRRHVDEHVVALLQRADEGLLERLAGLIVMGCHHEQQHQELLRFSYLRPL